AHCRNPPHSGRVRKRTSRAVPSRQPGPGRSALPGRRSARGHAGRVSPTGMALPHQDAAGTYDTDVSKTMENSYTARHLSVLEGLDAVRKRPGMYIGSTDSRGLMHCLWEIIDNSVDEALEGHGDAIEIILHPDMSVEVRDNGRGIPVDTVDSVGLSGVEVVYTKLHAGGKFGGSSYASSG